MRSKLISFIIVSFIVLIGLAIYLYKISEIPSGFYVDEAVSAYNSYSILKTGKDAFGQPFPGLFRLFGSYSPPLFIYFSVPFLYFFGLKIFTFRLISVVSAATSIVFFFLLVERLKLFKSPLTSFVITFFYACQSLVGL